MAVETSEFLIVGTTMQGDQFRPSDWAERLCGVMSVFGKDQRMRYSRYVHPVNAGGVKCVVVDIRLRELEPMAYDFLLGFAADNDLKVRPGRLVQRSEADLAVTEPTAGENGSSQG